MVIRAKYEDGVFKPLEDVKLSEGTVLYIDVPAKKRKAQSIRSYGFVGMWKGRKDIGNGMAYVDRLRDAPR